MMFLMENEFGDKNRLIFWILRGQNYTFEREM